MGKFMAETHMLDHLIYLDSAHLLFCFAFVHHLSRMISDTRRAYRHWSGGICCNTFALGWRIPMHHGDDFDPLLCIWLRCPLDCHETSTLFASVSAKRRGLNWFRGNLKGSLRRDFDSSLYRTSVSLFLQTDSGTHMHQ